MLKEPESVKLINISVFNILDLTTGNISFLITHNGIEYQTPVFEIKDKVNLNIDYISKSAKEKLEKVGSTIRLKQKD